MPLAPLVGTDAAVHHRAAVRGGTPRIDPPRPTVATAGGPPRRWGLGGPAAVAALAVYVLAATAWGLSGLGSEELRTDVSDLLPLPLELAAVLVLVRAARRSDDRRERRAWTLLAAALAVYGLGDLSWCVLEVGLDRNPFPSIADAGYLLYYPVIATSLLLFARRPVADRGHRARAALDVATVVVGGFSVIYFLFLDPILVSAQPSAWAEALSVGYPLGDIALLFAIATLLLRGASTLRSDTLLVLVASQVAFFVADLGFGSASSTGEYAPASWVDSTWLLALALIVVAGIVHLRPDALPNVHSRSASPRVQAHLPYLALLVGYGVVAWVAMGEAAFYPVGGVMLSAGALTAIVVARQVGAIRENARLLDALHVLATTDSLTGLTNRRRFYELAPDILERARDAGTPIALLMIDLDNFKLINDNLGHAAGDEAIQRVSEVCRALAPEGSIVARYGGDELIALLPGTDAHGALAHAQRVQAAVNDIRLEADPERTLTLSIGVASALAPPDVDELAGRADAALYEAKNSGRARVLVAAS